MSPPDEVTAGTNGGIRRDARTILAEPVELANLSRSLSAETTSTHNISSHGALVTTQLLLKWSEFLEAPNFNNMNSFLFNNLNRSQFSVDMRFGAQAARIRQTTVPRSRFARRTT